MFAEELDAQTLASLIQTCDVAIAELQQEDDSALDELIERLRKKRTQASLAHAWLKLVERQTHHSPVTG